MSSILRALTAQGSRKALGNPRIRWCILNILEINPTKIFTANLMTNLSEKSIFFKINEESFTEVNVGKPPKLHKTI